MINRKVAAKCPHGLILSYLFLLGLLSLMFDAECVILLKCLIAQSGSHLEDAVAQVTEAQCVLKIAQLQKQIWLCEALRLQEAIL